MDLKLRHSKTESALRFVFFDHFSLAQRPNKSVICKLALFNKKRALLPKRVLTN